ncbi:hypothetical protein [Streptomyces sp. NBC_00878]|uniref:hypothetical protein n=1 Tax=Streptomyces sp. NBC_00878 TaxID=2975854 RepID=UPI00225665DE|nr:hypothetical protein [Streptomyces sp. NBC_00878]MCX4903403.1 hypothetical protein [Streptomyces sp. NBC_00878]
MTTHAAASPLFSALVDDAGLFPPEALTMTAATTRHRRDSAAAHPLLTHRFLCTTGQLPELLAALGPEDRFRLGLITQLDTSTVPSTPALTAADPRIELAAVEGPLPPGPDPVAAARQALAALGGLPEHVPGYVEIPLTGDRPTMTSVLHVLTEGGRGAKVRCGGLRAELFPSCGQLAAFVHACVRGGVPFKATAGLHHAVRHRDERTGFTHHGFLNLLLAVCRAVDGGTAHDVMAVLGTVDAESLADEARHVPRHTAVAARALFTAYGSCSTSEPLEDLQALGLDAKETTV